MSKTTASEKCACIAEEALNAHALFKNGLNNLFNSNLPNSLTKFALLDMLREISTTNNSKSTLRDYCAALVESHYGVSSIQADNFGVDISLIAEDDSKVSKDYKKNLDALRCKGEQLMDSLHGLVMSSPELTRPIAERFYDTYADFQKRLEHIAIFGSEVENTKQPKPR